MEKKTMQELIKLAEQEITSSSDFESKAFWRGRVSGLKSAFNIIYPENGNDKKQYCIPQHTGNGEIVCLRCGRPCSFSPGGRVACRGGDSAKSKKERNDDRRKQNKV